MTMPNDLNQSVNQQAAQQIGALNARRRMLLDIPPELPLGFNNYLEGSNDIFSGFSNVQGITPQAAFEEWVANQPEVVYEILFLDFLDSLRQKGVLTFAPDGTPTGETARIMQQYKLGQTQLQFGYPLTALPLYEEMISIPAGPNVQAEYRNFLAEEEYKLQKEKEQKRNITRNVYTEAGRKQLEYAVQDGLITPDEAWGEGSEYARMMKAQQAQTREQTLNTNYQGANPRSMAENLGQSLRTGSITQEEAGKIYDTEIARQSEEQRRLNPVRNQALDDLLPMAQQLGLDTNVFQQAALAPDFNAGQWREILMNQISTAQQRKARDESTYISNLFPDLYEGFQTNLPTYQAGVNTGAAPNPQDLFYSAITDETNPLSQQYKQRQFDLEKDYGDLLPYYQIKGGGQKWGDFLTNDPYAKWYETELQKRKIAESQAAKARLIPKTISRGY